MDQSKTHRNGSEFDTRQRLLQAAGPVFAAHGFDRATVREICSTANVNIASVGYYFGDKMGLYREVIVGIREARDRRFPFPVAVDSDPRRTLLTIVRTILARMLSADESSWESQLVMREMQQPTPVFEEIIREFVRPLFENLMNTIQRLVGQPVPQHTLEQLALSTVGQCLYYAYGSRVVQILIPESERKKHYDVDSLSRHVTAVMLSATDHATVSAKRLEVDQLLESSFAKPANVETSSG